MEFLKTELGPQELVEAYAYEKILSGGHEYADIIAWARRQGISRATAYRGITDARKKIDRQVSQIIAMRGDYEE